MQSNHQPEEEDCNICNERLPKLDINLVRMTCCGKGLHEKCSSDIRASTMSDKLKNQCIICRTARPKSAKEDIERLCRWAEKGKAWAQCMLGEKYRDGVGVEQSYQQAKELFDLAASQGYAGAQCSLGFLYANGQGVDQSYERAAEYYEAAAREGMADAQSNLGVLYANGQGVDQSYERAVKYFEAAARQGMDSAQFNLGGLYANGQGVQHSYEIARAWWIKAAEQGHENSIKNLQQLDEFEGITTPSFTPPKRCSTCDAPKTSTHKLRNCKCKSAQYCNATCQKSHWKSHKKEHRRLCKEMELKNTEGEMKEEAVEEDEVGERKETVPVVSQQQEEEEEDVCPVCIEALQKDPLKFLRYTCCGKGIHRWCSEGIKVSSLSDEQKNSCPLCRAKHLESDEETIERLRPWVEKGKAWAQFMLGQRYERGLGVEQSYQQAFELYELAARQGLASALYNLGLMYDNGQGVDQSYARAAEYYEAAARQGLASAQYNLGAVYCNGQGVEQSNETAREWLMKAAEQGEESAINGLQIFDKAEGRTTPSFIPKPIECASCYRPHDPSEHKLRPCNGCHRVYYCGKECQVKHWKEEINGHKKKCNKKL